MLNADSISYAASKGIYSARIMPKDELTISVSAINLEAARPFNVMIQNTLTGSQSNVSYSTASLLPYIVDTEGYINFPVVGKLYVVGLTREQCQDMIQEKIKPYFTAEDSPIVLVRMTGYHVTVIGEVTTPKQISVPNEKINIFEALAQAGDLSVYGIRNNVLLIRETVTGEKIVHRYDLNDANIINSPYYYLQQNDIVYVEPNKVKARNASIGTSTTLWISLMSSAISLATFVASVTK